MIEELSLADFLQDAAATTDAARQSEPDKFSNSNFLDLSDQPRGWKNKPRLLRLFPRLFVFERHKQQRFQIITFLPAAIAFLSDPAVSPRDDVRTPEQTARIGLAGFPVGAKTFGFRMLPVAIQKVVERFNDCFLAELKRCKRRCEAVTSPIFRVANIHALCTFPFCLI